MWENDGRLSDLNATHAPQDRTSAMADPIAHRGDGIPVLSAGSFTFALVLIKICGV
jgi:hypothetical protein